MTMETGWMCVTKLHLIVMGVVILNQMSEHECFHFLFRFLLEVSLTGALLIIFLVLQREGDLSVSLFLDFLSGL